MTVLETELESGILALRLNRPQRLNALNQELVEALARSLARAAANDVRVVTLTGEGSSFCTGADVDEVLALTDERAAGRFLRELASVLGAIADLEKPVIAGFQGHAAGGGAELALEADLRVAADDAVLWFPDVGIGSTPASMWRLVRMVGHAVASEMALLGRSLDAAQMKRFGVVGQVLPAASLEGAVADLAARLRDGAGAIPLRYAKRSLRVAAEAPRDQDLAENVELMLACFSGDEQQRAVADFTGRGAERG